MIRIRSANERGHVNHGWLDTYHSFCFGDYHDSEWMGYRSLRVINDDRVAAGFGFPMHSHRDMEIITYVLEGELEHQDSMGNGGVIRPGEIQYMSSGTGVKHSEFNSSTENPVHLLQVWIIPRAERLEPTYAQKDFGDSRRGKLCLLASTEGRKGSLQIRQDADLYAAILTAGQSVQHSVPQSRGVWLQVALGELAINGEELQAGDAAIIEGEFRLEITSASSG
ncbi:MAG: pirin family protein, partial [bacterium]|nr:pirin family protein [bacterium]